MKRIYIIVVFILVITVQGVNAERLHDDFFPIQQNEFITSPQTREQVIRSYWRFVNASNGVSKIEAKIIAQFELLRLHLEGTYDVAKPKVIEETAEYWLVRLPSSFSLTYHKMLGQYLFCIDKNNGHLLWNKADPDKID